MEGFKVIGCLQDMGGIKCDPSMDKVWYWSAIKKIVAGWAWL